MMLSIFFSCFHSTSITSLSIVFPFLTNCHRRRLLFPDPVSVGGLFGLKMEFFLPAVTKRLLVGSGVLQPSVILNWKSCQENGWMSEFNIAQSVMFMSTHCSGVLSLSVAVVTVFPAFLFVLCYLSGLSLSFNIHQYLFLSFLSFILMVSFSSNDLKLIFC